MSESWKKCVGVPEEIEVSNQGRVRVLPHDHVYMRKGIHRVVRPMKGQILEPYLSLGYPTVRCTVHGVRYTYKVHRLVALAFVDGYDDGLVVNHINGIKTDNAISNLEWVTQGENNIHALQTGLRKNRSGNHHGMSKLSEGDVIRIRQSAKTQKELAKEFSVSPANICLIVNRQTWAHVH